MLLKAFNPTLTSQMVSWTRLSTNLKKSMHHALEGCYLELTNKQSDLHSECLHALTVHFTYSEFIMSIFFVDTAPALALS